MPEPFVVDASAVAKLFRTEAESESFRAWFAERVASRDSLLSPTIIQFELGEIIRGKEKIPPAEQGRILDVALKGLTLSDDALSASFEFGRELSFYDSSYVALAKARGATLVTYHGPLARQARRVGCPVLAPSPKVPS